jgi:PEP-CTERM motif
MESCSSSKIGIHFNPWLALVALAVCVTSLPAAAGAIPSFCHPTSIGFDANWINYLEWEQHPGIPLVGNIALGSSECGGGYYARFTTPPADRWYYQLRPHPPYPDEILTGGAFGEFGPAGSLYLFLPDGTLAFTGQFGWGWFGIDDYRVDDPDYVAEGRMFITGHWTDDESIQVAVLELVPGGGAHFFSYLTFQPVPEPGSLVLLGSGALGLAGLLRRKLS